MATLRVQGEELVVGLSWLERLEAFHGDLRVPTAAVRRVREVADPWAELRGIRSPGTGWPGKIAVGTRRGSFGKDFAVVHGRRPGVVVELEGAEFSRVVLTADDPAATVAGIGLPG